MGYQKLCPDLIWCKTDRLFHYRTKGGVEIDYIVELNDEYFPIEVKWTELPSEKDARHIIKFIDENSAANNGYIICRCARPMQITGNVKALPYWDF